MAVKITYFVHGTTTDNERHISSGWADVELSPLGLTQAQELSALVADKSFDAVFASDLKRAVHTAELVWGGKVPIVIDPRLRECNYGDYNGQPSSIVEPLQEQAIEVPMKNGESYEMVRERVEGFLRDLSARYDGKHIAIVAHKAPQLALDVILKGKTWAQAFSEDWRKKKAWQPGWEYEAN
jgi:broad specificity phosphatase PhoE